MVMAVWMLQIKKRSDTKRGVRFMATICLYQDTRHEKPLHWMREVFGIGYVSRRCDGISELRINGYIQVKNVLLMLKPFIHFKIIQTEALIEACEILSSCTIGRLSEKQLHRIVDLILVIKNENYTSQNSNNKEMLYGLLGLTP